MGETVKRHREHLWRLVVVALIAWSAFNIGLIQARRGVVPAQESASIELRDAIVSQTPAQGRGSTAAPQVDRSDPRVVISKSSSSKKYHYSWCSSGTRIKEENRVWFPSEADAVAAGYSLAGNCSK